MSRRSQAFDDEFPGPRAHPGTWETDIGTGLTHSACAGGLQDRGDLALAALTCVTERRDALVVGKIDVGAVRELHQALVERSGFPGVWPVARAEERRSNRSRSEPYPAASRPAAADAAAGVRDL